MKTMTFDEAKKSRVWLHKETGELYERFYSVFGYALTRVDLDNSAEIFTEWSDWIKRKLFAFDDCELYDKKKFIDLGEL